MSGAPRGLFSARQVLPQRLNSRTMTKTCTICGAAFAAPPSSKKITCSKRCSAEQKRRSHAGTANQWSADAKARIAAKGRTANLAQGTPAALASPRAGPFETHHTAKVWSLVNLDTGERYTVRNLAKFCRDHAARWDTTPQNAAAGLRQVQCWLTGRSKRTISRWKQWTLAEEAQAAP